MITSAVIFMNLTLQTEKQCHELPLQEAAASVPCADPEHPPFPSILTALLGAGRCLPSLVTADSVFLVLIYVIWFTLALLQPLTEVRGPGAVLQCC